MAGILTILLEGWREPFVCVRRRARWVPCAAPFPFHRSSDLAAAIASAVNSVAGGGLRFRIQPGVSAMIETVALPFRVHHEVSQAGAPW